MVTFGFYLFLEELKSHIRYHSNSRGVAYAPWGCAVKDADAGSIRPERRLYYPVLVGYTVAV